jgi:hypothetical protein
VFLHYLVEEGSRRWQIVRRDRTMAARLPLREECLKYLVHKPALLPRIHHLLIVGVLLETKDVLREELERTGEIRLDRAHGQRTRPLWPGGAVILRTAGIAPFESQRQPLTRSGQREIRRDGFVRHGLKTIRCHSCEKRGRLDERLVVEHERRYDCMPRRRSREVEKGRRRRGAAILF